MGKIHLVGLDSDQPLSAEQIGTNFQIILRTLNGGLDTGNLSAEFSLPVDKITGALPITGGTLRGDLECDDSKGNVRIDGVDISELGTDLRDILANLHDLKVVAQDVEADLMATGFTDPEIEVSIPEGFNHRDFVVLGAITGLNFSLSAGTLARFNVTHTVESNPGLCRVRLNCIKELSAAEATGNINIAYRVVFIFWRRGALEGR